MSIFPLLFLLIFLSATCSTISYPEPSNFLERMLDENEGSGKDRFLGDPDWLSEM